MKAEVAVNPDMLTWAIARAGYQLHDFIAKYPKVQQWIDNIKKPTVKQLEKFSQSVHLPFGYLFLPEPPQEHTPFPFFRTGGKTGHNVSLNVYDTILILQRRQDWLTEYLTEGGHSTLSFVGKYSKNADYKAIVEDIRDTLSLTAAWAADFKTYEDTLKFITLKIEQLGIIVTFNGVVQNNTRRPISVEECRGFVLVNEMAPLMFINASDAKAAQLFTIIHELAHVWIGQSAGFDNQNLIPADDPMELLCDHVAAELLVPEHIFLDIWEKNPDIRNVARYFKVSPIVIGRRALDLGKLSRRDFFSFYNAYIDGLRFKKESQESGGDFYATARKRISVSFATHVHQAVRENKLLFRDAYKMTGLKGNTYQNFVTNHLY